MLTLNTLRPPLSHQPTSSPWEAGAEERAAALGRKESKTVRMVSTPTAKLMLHVTRSLQLRQERGAFVAGERKEVEPHKHFWMVKSPREERLERLWQGEKEEFPV